jgi:muramoyltetrapeptide carboxypeptidase
VWRGNARKYYLCGNNFDTHAMTNELTYPPFLKTGDTVVMLSPSGKIDHSFLRGARRRLKSWGLNVVMAPHAATSHGWYAGSTRQRLGDLQRALDDEKVRAIWCSRGGYGAVHLLEQLDLTREPDATDQTLLF